MFNFNLGSMLFTKPPTIVLKSLSVTLTNPIKDDRERDNRETIKEAHSEILIRNRFQNRLTKARDANHFDGVVEDSIFQGESQLMVIKLDPKTYGDTSLRLRLPNGSAEEGGPPGVGEKITLGLKVADSYFVEAANGGA